MKLQCVIIFTWFVLSEIGAENGVRPKRIIGGRKLLDIRRKDAPFKALQYVVWIGRVWSCFESPCFWRGCWFRYLPFAADIAVTGAFAFLYYYCATESPKNLHCGGSLITPRIVQTSCHCVAYLDPPILNNLLRRLWGRFNLYRNLEDELVVFMGQHDVHAFRHAIRAESFAAHQKCGMMQIAPFYVRYDVGWIILEDRVPDNEGVLNGIWSPPLDYAGPYKEDDLLKFHEKVQEQRHVCLIMGWGDTKEFTDSPSRILKIGWVQIYDFTHCYEILWKGRGTLETVHFIQGQHYFIDYNRSGIFICSSPLTYSSDLGGQHWFGDSGGPITCGNNYFALVTGITGGHDPDLYYRTCYCKRVPDENDFCGAGCYNISRETAVASVPESMAVEKRRRFEEDIFAGNYREAQDDIFSGGRPAPLKRAAPMSPKGYVRRYPFQRKAALPSRPKRYFSSSRSATSPILGQWILASIIILYKN